MILKKYQLGLQSQSLENVALQVRLSFSCQDKHNAGQLSGTHCKKLTQVLPPSEATASCFLGTQS